MKIIIICPTINTGKYIVDQIKNIVTASAWNSTAKIHAIIYIKFISLISARHFVKAWESHQVRCARIGDGATTRRIKLPNISLGITRLEVIIPGASNT